MVLHARIEELIRLIHTGQRVTAADWPADAGFSPTELGLQEQASGDLGWAVPVQSLSTVELRQALVDLNISHFHVIDSTNTQLVSAGAAASVAGQLYIAEFQYGGKGRRGRQWLSPYARNLALSLGCATDRALSELGGLSLVVGLALADLFEELGVADVQLKWPNDILIEGCKLSGVLVELVQQPHAVEVVVGVGVNVELSDGDLELIDQPVTDLRRLGVTESRSELAARLVQRVRAHLALFEREGFAPFVNAFNDLHVFHGQTCAIIQGQDTTHGVVSGIGEQGELMLRTDQGEQRFHGGEVSLRPQKG